MFAAKLKDLVGLYMHPPDNALVLCVDEKFQIQALERTQPLFPLRESQRVDYERHGTMASFAALNVLTGEVIGECKDHHKTGDYREFPKRVDKQCEVGKGKHGST